MAVEIRRAESRRDFRRGVMLPFTLHRGNECWVPPLINTEINIFDKNNNPAFEVCEAQTWLAFREGKVVGRVTGIINRPFIEKWGKKHARFGWMDYIDDKEVSDALFDTVESWAKEKGMDSIVGPMGFSDFDDEGLLIEGFNELGTFAMLYNPPYYRDHVENRGYRKEADWVEFSVTIPVDDVPEKVKRVLGHVMERNNLRLADITKRNQFKPYIPGIFKVLQDSYKDLYGYVPLTEKQVAQITKEYFSYVDPRFTKVVLDNNNEVAAVGIALPSLSRAMQKAKGRLLPFGFLAILKAMKKPEILDLYLVAVRRDMQNRGVNSILMNAIQRNAMEAGITHAETNGELEDNQAVQSFWKHYDARQHKRRRVFIKDL
jgi:GNAT superfamily N-acetyltransferase